MVEVDGVALYVEETPGAPGTGDPIVLLHGFTGSTATWEGHREALARLGPVIAVDLVGHGRSGAPEAVDRYRMERCVADLLALFDRLDLRRVRLVGYSMGGRVALHVTLAAPARVACLVLESASPGIADPAEREQRRRQDEALADRIEREGIAAFVRYWESLPLFATQQRLPAAVRKRLRAQRLANRPRGLANSLRGMGAGAQEPLWDRLPELDLPVLVVVGELDAKYCGIAQEMVRRLPRGRLAVVPGAGHAVHLERPEAFIQVVGTFLAAPGTPAGVKPGASGSGTSAAG
ncbi:MAG: 2-succinyl-6-hydroxy-2,4-cyclohexadiene-1-carboxylate synthase [Bacillota bacterium]|nr:MAG: 2-succinyl-6-hydroxy-2,4-cyclohexadiene-1-carboxylate synthase [Bacillota bacterium]